MLGRKAAVFGEGDWREFHRDYLKKNKIISGVISGACFAVAIGSFIGIPFCRNGFVAVLALLAVVGLLGGFVSLFQFLNFRRHLNKSLFSKNYYK